MRTKLTTEFLRTLPREDKDFYDAKYPGLVLRCRASGSHVWRVNYGRGKWLTLGRVDVLTADEARGKARDELSAISKGLDPQARRQRQTRDALTLRQFVAQHYEPWALEHQKRGAETVQRIRSVFVDLLDLKVSALSAWTVEKWRTERLKTATRRPKPATVNSHLTLLKSVLAKAVAWKLLATHPLASVKPLKADQAGRVRYLSPDEETRLRAALTARDVRRQARRASANAWRAARGYAPYPMERDHLTPIVLLALNTGLRKGEVFGLEWRDVDLSAARLTVRGEGAKSGQTRYVPLNVEARRVLTDWRASAAGTGVVFPGRADGEALSDVKRAWLPLVRAAQVNGFRFHDLRHTFASKLVMAGVDLNTVRELLGHADLKMTLRYAHLAPAHKAAAVARLIEAR